ncbi:hypothetical protein D9M68_999370 [compost metagenome]
MDAAHALRHGHPDAAAVVAELQQRGPVGRHRAEPDGSAAKRMHAWLQGQVGLAAIAEAQVQVVHRRGI